VIIYDTNISLDIKNMKYQVKVMEFYVNNTKKKTIFQTKCSFSNQIAVCFM